MIAMPSDDQQNLVARVSTKRHRESLLVFTISRGPEAVRWTATEDGGCTHPTGLSRCQGRPQANSPVMPHREISIGFLPREFEDPWP